MDKPDLAVLSELELLRLHGSVLAELCRRGVCRTNNNPIADYTEWLISTRLGLRLEGGSKAAYDAVDQNGVRYQIKGRRLTALNGSTQLSAIRNLEAAGFDFLVGVMFNDDYSVAYAFSVPHAIVLTNAKYQEHTNSHLFYLRRSLASESGVRDITTLVAVC
jgi:hypothetical protein